MDFREFFYFNKSDRRILSSLLLVAVAFIAVYYFFGNDEEQYAENSGYIPQNSRYSNGRYRHYPHKYYYVDGQKAELFPFDPNTADSTQLLRLGLHPWQVRCIYKYRAKGGIYRKPQDFARLYGLTAKQFLQMRPFIMIGQDFQPASSLYMAEKVARDSIIKTYPQKLHEGEIISLNASDTSAMKKVPGVGSYYARQIYNYRKRLGGFCSVEQLREIDNFPVNAIKYFNVSDVGSIRKLNVNRLSLNELKRHPYINFYQARAIVAYRRTSGPLKSLEDLSLLEEFPPEEIKRLRPYIEF